MKNMLFLYFIKTDNMSIQIVIIFVLALLSVSIIDTLGPIIANKFKFNYAYFIIFSFATYFLSGFFLSMFATANTVLFLSGMVGFYDGTVGVEIAKRFNGYQEADLKFIETKKNILGIVSFCLALIFGGLGRFLYTLMVG